MGRLTGHRHKKEGGVSSGEIVDVVTGEKKTFDVQTSGAAAIPRSSSYGSIGNGAVTPISRGSTRRRPSLIFAEDDSLSDDLTGPTGPKRRCSFVSSDDGLPEVMDLRRMGLFRSSGKSLYDLSVCSGSSFETMQTSDALGKMEMFEVALSSRLKTAAAAKKENSDHSVSSDDERRPVGLINVFVARSRQSLWSVKRGSIDSSPIKRRESYPRSTDSIPIHSSMIQGPDNDSSAVAEKKNTLEDSKTSRRKRKVQILTAALAFSLLSILFASAVAFQTEDTDPSSLVSSFTTKTVSMIENLFQSSSEEELRQEQEIMDEPSVIPADEYAAQHERMMAEKRSKNRQRRQEENKLRRERVARNRQARIEAQEEKRRMGQHNLRRDDGSIIPQEPELSEDAPHHDRRLVKLTTFVY